MFHLTCPCHVFGLQRLASPRPNRLVVQHVVRCVHVMNCMEVSRKCLHASSQEHQDPRMLHTPREVSSCGSGIEMASNGGYQTAAYTTGRSDAYGELFKAILQYSRTRELTVLTV